MTTEHLSLVHVVCATRGGRSFEGALRAPDAPTAAVMAGREGGAEHPDR